MEDILEVYKRPYDPKRPLICFDEGLRCLFAEKFAPEPVRPGKPRRSDYPYQAAGSRKLLLACEPLAGSRVVRVSKRRTKSDWARFMRELIEVHYPQAERVVLVMDNLTTHNPTSFYQTFSPEVARRLTEKLEIHYTEVSWQLVKYGRDRVERLSSLPAPTHRQRRGVGTRSGRLAKASQYDDNHHRVAIQHR